MLKKKIKVWFDPYVSPLVLGLGFGVCCPISQHENLAILFSTRTLRNQA
jgi:hypothetical protein